MTGPQKVRLVKNNGLYKIEFLKWVGIPTCKKLKWVQETKSVIYSEMGVRQIPVVYYSLEEATERYEEIVRNSIRRVSEWEVVKEDKLGEEIKKPQFPVTQFVREGDSRKKCKVCGSSMERKWFVKEIGCISPECIDYWMRKQTKK